MSASTGYEPPDEVVAREPVDFPAESSLLALGSLRSGSVERVVARLHARKTNLVFNDAKLEGNTYTEPEVQTLLESIPDADRADDFEANQILALSEATDLVIQRALGGTFALDKRTSDDLHRLVGEFEALDAGLFRGEGVVASDGGAVNAMGMPFRAPAPGDGGAHLRALFSDGVERLSTYGHPAAVAVGYAAFATYNQFYFDANKRTSRLMMNGILMSAGFDAIVTPAIRQAEYNRSLRAMFETGDLAPYMAFLLSCSDD